MIYFDTAYLARCYLEDESYEAVRGLAENDVVACSELGRAELSAVFHRKRREGAIDDQTHEILLAQLEQDDRDEIWQWLTLDRDVIDRVMESFRALPADLFVRTADAVHLSTAKHAGVTRLFTNDRHMLRAAPHFGVAADDIIGRRG